MGNKNSWYEGANRYQEFLYNNNMINEYEDFIQNWSGFISLVGSNYGSKHFSSYLTSETSQISYSDWVKEAHNVSGVSSVVVLGWNQGGFDSMYPDYNYAEGDGFNGKEGFEQMTANTHANDDLIINHINSRLADMESVWSKTVIDNQTGLTNMVASGVKRVGYDETLSPEDALNYMVVETYGSGTMYYVMSSAGKEFQNQLKSVVERLRKSGSNGIWFDQLFERDAYLDYDKNHKMSENSTPATLYAEGYQQIFEYFDEIKNTYSVENPFIIIGGGLGGDYFAKWVDVYGGNWARKLGSRDNSVDSSLDKIGTETSDRHQMTPEIINFTVPAVYIGQAAAGTLSGQSDEYARAFLMGMPFLVEQTTSSTKVLIQTYDNYADIYYEGKYLDKQGLTYSNDGVMAAVIKGKDRIGLQIYNQNESVENITIQINLLQMGIDKKIKTIIDAFTGQKYNVNDGKITVKLNGLEFTALIITIE